MWPKGPLSSKGTHVWTGTSRRIANRVSSTAHLGQLSSVKTRAAAIVYILNLVVGLFKRQSVQPRCILGGLRFRSTAIRFFKSVWCFLTAGFARETTEERLDLKSLKGRTKAKELRTPDPHLLSPRLPLKAL